MSSMRFPQSTMLGEGIGLVRRMVFLGTVLPVTHSPASGRTFSHPSII